MNFLGITFFGFCLQMIAAEHSFALAPSSEKLLKASTSYSRPIFELDATRTVLSKNYYDDLEKTMASTKRLARGGSKSQRVIALAKLAHYYLALHDRSQAGLVANHMNAKNLLSWSQFAKNEPSDHVGSGIRDVQIKNAETYLKNSFFYFRSYFKLASKKNSHYQDASLGYGAVLVRLRSEVAIKWLKANKLRSDDEQSRWSEYWMGQAYARQGNWELARKNLITHYRDFKWEGHFSNNYLLGWAEIELFKTTKDRLWLKSATKRFGSLLRRIETSDEAFRNFGNVVRSVCRSALVYLRALDGQFSKSVQVLESFNLDMQIGTLAILTAQKQSARNDQLGAINTLSTAYQLNPQSNFAPMTRVLLLDELFSTKNYSKFDSTLRNIDRLYIKGSDWYRGQDSSRFKEKAIRNVLAEDLNFYKSHLNAVMKTGRYSPSVVDSLITIHAILFDSFPASTNGAADRENYASYLEIRGKNNLAASQLSYACPTKAKGKQRADCWQRQVSNLEKVMAEVGPKPQLIKSLQGAFTKVEKESQNMSEKSDAAFSAAKLEFAHGKPELGIRAMTQLVGDYPSEKVAQSAAVFIVNDAKKDKNYPSLLRSAGLILKNREKIPIKLASYLGEEMRLARLKLAYQFFKKGKFLEALAEFDRYYDEYSKHPSAPDALYKAAFITYQQGDYRGFFQRSIRCRKSFRAHPDLAKLEYLLGQTYAKTGQFDEAISVNVDFLKARPGDSRSALIALSNARMASVENQIADAVKHYQFFIRNFSKNPMVPQALLELAQLLDNNNKQGEAINIFRRYVTQYPQNGNATTIALTSEIRIGLEAGDESYLKRAYSVLDWLEKKKSVDIPEANKQLSLALIAILRRNGEKIAKTVIAGEQVKADLQILKRGLKDMGDLAKKIFALKSEEEILAALYELGKSHEAVSRVVGSATIPESWGPKQQFSLKTQLKALSFPLLGEARKYYSLVIDRARTSGVVSTFKSKAQKSLASLGLNDRLLEVMPYPGVSRIAIENDASLPRQGYYER